MISELSKSFDRYYVVGFFVPSLLFASLFLLLLVEFGVLLDTTTLEILLAEQTLWTSALALFSVWLISILVSAMNRPFIRLLEGYGILQRFPNLEVRRYHRLQKEYEETAKKYRDNLEVGVPDEVVARYTELLLTRRIRFPDSEKLVLPTEFGNVIRAFEVYSRVMYGIDAIPFWPHLSAVIPEDYQRSISAAKAEVDFAVNLFYFSFMLLLEYLILILASDSIRWPWFPFVLLISAWLNYRLAVNAAKSWGNRIKAAFDLFRYDLLRQMGVRIPKDWGQERHLWENLSQSLIYWYKPDWPRNEPEPEPESDKSKDHDDVQTK